MEATTEYWLQAHAVMARARVLEECLITMSKGGEGYFWIGGPGEEGFNVPLGLAVRKGRGLDHDFLHLHYRSSAILLAMGAPVIDAIRQMRAARTDPYSRGRNFVNHPAVPDWNIPPVFPTIATQYTTAIGSGIAQARAGGTAITIVNGGDAGTAEGDFHSCLVWANRPALPLPILIIVTNNGFGISTSMRGQHGEARISDFAKAFGMPGRTVDGNDAMASHAAIAEAMAYVRRERRPYLLEATVSRLYGHSSSSGANRVEETDCIRLLADRLLAMGAASRERLDEDWTAARAEVAAARQAARAEPSPAPEDIWEHVYAEPLGPSYPRRGGS